MKTVLVLEDESVRNDVIAAHAGDITASSKPATQSKPFACSTAHGREIDLLVADVTLPRSSGIQVAPLLRFKITNFL